jgi:DNA-binding Xre family transcriptional regulator
MNVALSDLVKRKMEEEHLSLRGAGAAADVAHTTIDRVIKGEPVDLLTLEKVCDWLAVPVTSILDLREDEGDLSAQVAAIVAMCPELEVVFSEMSNLVVSGEIDKDVLSEVAAFAAYRLSHYRQG